MTALPVSRIQAKNFRSLRDVDVPLRSLSILAGPNGSGKSNLLKVLQFITTSARFDIDDGLRQWGGFDHVQRQAKDSDTVELVIEGQVTDFASVGAPDSYRLRLTKRRDGWLQRTEELNFKRVEGRGRKITVQDTRITVDGRGEGQLASRQTSGLGTLARLSSETYGPGPAAYLKFLTTIRVIEPNVDAARLPSRLSRSNLDEDAANLANVLYALSTEHPDEFDSLLSEVRQCLPGLRDITFVPVFGTAPQVSIQLDERGLSAPIALADASFGTVRLLALLAALHDPNPSRFLVIEEVDHGLHPYALDVLVDRMRLASKKTQILAATHSPTLLNRLTPSEIVLCDRDAATGESLIPARTEKELARAIKTSGYGLGELWFSGALGAVPA